MRCNMSAREAVTITFDVMTYCTGSASDRVPGSGWPGVACGRRTEPGADQAQHPAGAL